MGCKASKHSKKKSRGELQQELNTKKSELTRLASEHELARKNLDSELDKLRAEKASLKAQQDTAALKITQANAKMSALNELKIELEKSKEEIDNQKREVDKRMVSLVQLDSDIASKLQTLRYLQASQISSNMVSSNSHAHDGVPVRRSGSISLKGVGSLSVSTDTDLASPPGTSRSGYGDANMNTNSFYQHNGAGSSGALSPSKPSFQYLQRTPSTSNGTSGADMLLSRADSTHTVNCHGVHINQSDSHHPLSIQTDHDGSSNGLLSNGVDGGNNPVVIALTNLHKAAHSFGGNSTTNNLSSKSTPANLVPDNDSVNALFVIESLVLCAHTPQQLLELVPHAQQLSYDLVYMLHRYASGNHVIVVQKVLAAILFFCQLDLNYSNSSTIVRTSSSSIDIIDDFRLHSNYDGPDIDFVSISLLFIESLGKVRLNSGRDSTGNSSGSSSSSSSSSDDAASAGTNIAVVLVELILLHIDYMDVISLSCDCIWKISTLRANNLLLGEAHVCDVLVDILRKYLFSVHVVDKCLNAFFSICVCAENRKRLEAMHTLVQTDAGPDGNSVTPTPTQSSSYGYGRVLAIVAKKYIDHASVCRHVYAIVAALTQDVSHKHILAHMCGVDEIILDSLKSHHHRHQPQLAQAGCLAIAGLSSNKHTENIVRLGDFGVCELLCSIIRLHKESDSVIEPAFLAIVNLAVNDANNLRFEMAGT
jgi:hypothetical protein